MMTGWLNLVDNAQWSLISAGKLEVLGMFIPSFLILGITLRARVRQSRITALSAGNDNKLE